MARSKKEIAAEREKLVQMAVRRARSISRSARVAALRAYRGFDIDFIQPAIDILDEFPVTLQSAMIAAHMTGQVRALDNAEGHVIPSLTLAADPYAGSINALRRRLEASDMHIKQISDAYGATAINVGRTGVAAVERKLQEASVRIVEQGMHVRQATAEIRKAFQVGGVGTGNPWLFETLARTQIAIAYSAGRWSVNNTPIIQEALWGYEYVTIDDSRVRESHEELEGTTLPKDNPLWNSIAPPNGFNCRCDILEIYKDETALQVEKEPEPGGGPDEGFDVNFGQVFGVAA